MSDMPEWMTKRVDPALAASADAKEAFVREFDEATKRLPHRPRGHYLGMSGIGHCMRKQWLAYHRPKLLPSEPEPRLRRIFELGHACEEQAMAIMERMGGLHIVSTQAEYEDFGGRFRGHSDVVFRWDVLPGALIVGDWKTMNARRFAEFEKRGLKESNPVYYAQLELYALYEHADWIALFAYCKDTSEVTAQFLPFDAEDAERFRERAKAILDGPCPTQCDGGVWCECRKVQAP